jgi:hypothetical protein
MHKTDVCATRAEFQAACRAAHEKGVAYRVEVDGRGEPVLLVRRYARAVRYTPDESWRTLGRREDRGLGRGNATAAAPAPESSVLATAKRAPRQPRVLDGRGIRPVSTLFSPAP